MTKKSKLYRHGKYVRDLDPHEGYVFADGESLRVDFMDAMPIFDSASHRPGFVVVTDTAQDQRAQTYFDRREKISRAWQDVAPLAAAPLVADVSATGSSAVRDARLAFAGTAHITGDANAAYAHRSAALERAWEASR